MTVQSFKIANAGTRDSPLTANEMLAADVRVGTRIVVLPVDHSKP